MPPPADYHMHTHLCRHAIGTATELAARAVELGFTEIGFSEHNPMLRDDWDDWHPLQRDLETYLEQVEQARRDHSQLEIKLALETDYLPGHEDWIRQLTARAPWDYLIGAVHYVSDSWDLDNPKKISEWKMRDPWAVWSAYFERLTQAAESGLFDIIAHADLCKKFCFYPKQDCTPLFLRLLKAMKVHGLALELNTAGLRKDCREIYPSSQIVKLAFELGLPITFASDAHAPGEVGANFPEAVALAREAGYTQRCRFTRRKREMVKL
jgi:histidinol-phosphatase (PHP family)